MSLLPQTMLEPSAPLGWWVTPDGQRIPVIIDQNWWLLVYQLTKLALPTGAGLPADALQDLAGADIDAADSDAIALRQPLRNLQMQVPDESPAFPPPGLAQALMLAQDGLLPDPAPLAQPVASISVGASPFAYTAPFAGTIAVTGGTVSAIAIKRQGATVATGLITGLIPACRGDIVTVTYTGTPTMTFIPWSNA